MKLQPIRALLAPLAARAALLLACSASTTWAASAATHTQALPQPLPLGTQAEEIAALPGGHWLALEKQRLRLIDATGTERATLAVRGEHLDTRPRPGGALAVLVDTDTQRTWAVNVDLERMRLEAQVAVESPPYSLEAMCLYRDGQGNDHVFLIGDEGLAEQWLLRKAGSLLVRRLALPPQVEGCRVDDTAHWLYVNEKDAGIWAYGAEAEGPPQRHAVALARPLGPLAQGAAAMAVLPGGLAVLEGEERRLSLLRLHGEAAWRPAGRLQARSAAKAEFLAVLPGPTAAAGTGTRVAWRDDTRKTWSAHALPAAPRATSATSATSAISAQPDTPPWPIVKPRLQTAPVARFGDAADDPAIWVHPSDASRSLMLGTNKKQGLLVYDLAGTQRQLLESGRLNNVDVRQQVRFGERRLDVAVATQRDDLSVVVFLIDAEGQVSEHTRIPTGLPEIYGLCLYQPKSGGLEVFVNDKDGSYLRLRFDGSAERLTARPVQRFKLASQPEACVADDAQARLFMGEERHGVWALSLDAPVTEAAALTLVMPLGPMLHADVEGMGLHTSAAGSYLVVSSQGSNSYVVMDAAPPWRVRGAFAIGMDAERGIDGVSETDGLDLTAASLGPAFPRGMLVVQDGFKRLPDGPQNFKVVAWEDIAAALGLP